MPASVMPASVMPASVMPASVMPAIDEVERMAFAAWPAEEVGVAGPWRLRFMNGVSRRANSVWPGEAPEAGDARAQGERVAEAEAWYAARGLPTMFQINPDVHPALDAFLAARGYGAEAHVSVQIADPHAVASVARPAARVFDRLDDEWFELSALRGRFARVAVTYRGLLERIGDRATYALATLDGRPAAVGMGVFSGSSTPAMGIFSMMTVPEARRRGGGRAVLAALAGAAAQRGAPFLYLLVERENTAASALYAGASFRELYGYHYRVRTVSTS
jgi:N-acetylglutamate synthase